MEFVPNSEEIVVGNSDANVDNFMFLWKTFWIPTFRVERLPSIQDAMGWCKFY